MLRGIPWLIFLQTALSPINNNIRLPAGAGTAVRMLLQGSRPIIEMIETNIHNKGWPF